jgi:hypothetical protein
MKLLRFLPLLFLLPHAMAAQTTAAQCTADTSAPSVLLASGITTTSYIDSTPTDGVTYGYVVTAVDMAGNSCSNVVTNALIPSTGVHTVSLSWTASTTAGVTYSVFRAQSPAPPASLVVTVD